MSEDIVDVYDRMRRPLGRTGVRYTDLGEGAFRLVIHVCIFNSRNEILIQKRVASKKTFPGYWDVSVGGGVAAGETTQKAAGRELEEELGIVHVFDSHPAVSLTTEKVFDDFFILRMDLSPEGLRLQEDEVEEARWASLDEVLGMLDSGEFIPYDRGLLTYLFHLGKDGLTEYS